MSIKASDDHGNATLLDVIYGLQFAVDMRADYGIRVVNLSLESSQPQRAGVDPLDAAVEQAWLHGLVVVAAAGNRGKAADAVSYAPGNDPYAISVGAADDRGTKTLTDDALATWSSRGVTQEGRRKPDVIAPGSHLVRTLAPGSDFATTVPDVHRRRRVHPPRWDVDGRGGRLRRRRRPPAGFTPTGSPTRSRPSTWSTARDVSDVGKEIAADVAIRRQPATLSNPNKGLVSSTLLDPATGNIDYTKASWSKASWSSAASLLKASWSKASWTCACSFTETGAIDPARASWSKASWSSAWEK